MGRGSWRRGKGGRAASERLKETDDRRGGFISNYSLRPRVSKAEMGREQPDLEMWEITTEVARNKEYLLKECRFT